MTQSPSSSVFVFFDTWCDPEVGSFEDVVAVSTDEFLEPTSWYRYEQWVDGSLVERGYNT